MARKLKRWMSSLLAAAVAVSVMPMGGIAVFGSQEREASYASGGGYLEENGDSCGYQRSAYGIDALSGGEDSGNVASVTKNGETTYVADLTAAFTSENSGAEVKLLGDVTVSQTIEINTDFPAALDLAGHTVYAEEGIVGGSVFFIQRDFKIKDSAGNGAVKEPIDAFGHLTLEGGTFQNVSCSEKGEKSLTVTGDNVYIDNLKISNAIVNTGAVQLSAGTYGNIYYEYGCKKLLAGGGGQYYAFHDADGWPVPVSDGTIVLQNVTVRACSHDSSVTKYVKVGEDRHKMTCLACGYEGEPEAHKNGENGGCAVCSAVKVTKDGVADYLTSLADAFQSEYDGAVITLLDNINTRQAINVASGAFTLDLAGYAVNFSGTNVRLEVGGSANLTIRDSAGGGCLNSIDMPGQENNAVLTLEGGGFDDISAAGGTLIVTGDEVNIGRLSAGKSNARLSAGTYGSIRVLRSSGGYSLGDILLDYGQTEGAHYAFYDSEDNLVEAAANSVQNVTVKECSHEGARIKEYTRLDEERHNFTCLACGYGIIENHNASGAGGLCECIAVKVERDGNTEYKSSLNDAFLAAQSGAVITLLKDIKGGQIDASNKSVTLELDGHAIFGGLRINGADLTINGGAENGTIEKLLISDGTLTVNGGRFTSVFLSNCHAEINGGDFSGGTCGMEIYGGTLTVNDGRFTSGVASDGIAVSLNNCHAEINGGDFSGGMLGIEIYDSEVTVNGGCFDATGKLSPDYEGMGYTVSGLRFDGGTLRLRGGEFSGKDCAVEIASYPDEEETAALSGLLGHTDTKRYAYYNSAAPVTEGLDGTSLTGTITVKECNHAGEGVCSYAHIENTSTHTRTCLACGQTLDAENCAYTFSGTAGVCAACKGSVAVEVSGTDSLIYDGAAKTPGVTVTRDGTALAAGADYSVSYADNVNAGAAKVTVTIGNNQGAYNGNFTIGKATPKVTWSGASQELAYTGNPAAIAAPAVTLVNGEDFNGTIRYSYKKQGGTAYKDGLPTDAGTYTVKAHVDAAGNYAAADSADELALTIKKADAEITVLTDAYDVNYGDPAFTISGVTDTNPETAVQYAVTEGTDVLSVSNGTVTIRNAGTAAITVSLPESANYNAAENKTITVNVAKKSGYAADALNRNYFYQDGGTDSIDLAALLPKDCGNVDYGEPAVSGNVTYSAAPAVSGGKLSYTLESGNVNEEGTITVAVVAQNYEGITFTVAITRSACDHVAGVVLYTGEGEMAPTCTENGLGHRECGLCGDVTESGIVVKAPGHDWHIASETAATVTSAGKRVYACSRCGQKREESIPKLPPVSTGTPGKTEKPEESAKQPQGTVTPEEMAENSEMLDSGISVKWKGNAIALQWKKTKGAEGYDIFAARSGKKLDDKSLVQTVESGKTSVSIAKMDGKKISSKQAYAVKIKAWKHVNGKKAYTGESGTYYVAGKDNKKYTNVKKLRPKKKKYAVKKGRSVRVQVTAVKESKKKKLLPKSCGPALRYRSGNEEIAAVTQKGKVKAKKKGTCYIYVTALNGAGTKIKITVK